MQQLGPLLLLALSGFLAGGVLATWRNSRAGAVVLAVLAALALAAGIVWLV